MPDTPDGLQAEAPTEDEYVDEVPSIDDKRYPTEIDAPLLEAGELVLTPLRKLGRAARGLQGRLVAGRSDDEDGSATIKRTLDPRIVLAIGLFAVGLGAAGGVILAAPGAVPKMIQIGALRVMWAFAVLWIAPHLIDVSDADRPALAPTIALTFALFALSLSPVGGTLITLLWAVVVALVLRRRFGASTNGIGRFLLAAIGFSMAATLMRWVVQWVWLFAAVQRGGA